MASNLSFNLSPDVLFWARDSMGYSIEQAADKVGVPVDKYLDWELGRKTPTYKQLENLAEKVFKRSVAFLFLSKPPLVDSINKDFRSLSNEQIANLSPEIRIAVRRAKRYQVILDEVDSKNPNRLFANFKVSVKDTPSATAIRLREFLNFPMSDQKSWKQDDAHRNFQRIIESTGLYIFKMQMPMQEARAFCLTGEYPVIVLNTDDSKNGMIFSMFHEMCHILFNNNDVFKDSQSGELNKEYSEIETFCNRFAASFLVPDEYFIQDVQYLSKSTNTFNDRSILNLARTYNVSGEVIARKLLALDLISVDLFWQLKSGWDSAAKYLKEKQNEKLRESENGGLNPAIKIIYSKGAPYISKVLSAYSEGVISSSDLSNYLETKLKNIPKIIERMRI
jgi:Zn-dependent peptidase ImmA (M78 family)/transcriptional regulator with XRE-family HTH domain